MTFTAFVPAAPVLARISATRFTTSFAHRSAAPVSAPVRHSAVISMKDGGEKKRGFTLFSEQVNGRAAMAGFILAIVIEAITGRGIIGQLAYLSDITNLASALGN